MGPTLDLNFPEVPENREALSQLVHRPAKVVRDLILVGEVLDHAGLPRAVLQEEEVEGLELSPVLPGIPVVVSDHRPPRNVAGNPDSPQVVIFSTSFADVLLVL